MVHKRTLRYFDHVTQDNPNKLDILAIQNKGEEKH